MKSNCLKFSDSISPRRMPTSNKEIHELLNCLESDTKIYLSSLKSDDDSFIHQFKESVLPVIQSRKLSESYKSQLTKYSRVLEIKKVSTLRAMIDALTNLNSDFDTVAELGEYGQKTPPSLIQYRIELEKIVYIDFSNLLLVASQLFFALEFYCKILCSLGCVRFAMKVARAETIQHDECWKQLKRLSDRNTSDCETCSAYDTCNSKIDFEALSRIYSYSMKIRQIADYTPKLVSLDIYDSGLVEPPLIYFYCLHSVLHEDSLIRKCLDLLTPIAAPLSRSLLKELASPSIWGDKERLKEAIKNDKTNDFYLYLLGRFYHQKNLNDLAAKSLEKARRLNPKSAQTWKLLGVIYADSAKTRSQLLKGIRYIGRAAELAPTNARILCTLGTMEIAIGRHTSALRNLKRAQRYAEKGLDKAWALLCLSEAYRIKGMFDKSRYYRKLFKELRGDITLPLKILRELIDEQSNIMKRE